MNWKDMISGGKGALTLLLFTIGIAISIGINSFVGLFIGGSLEQAGDSANFSTQVQDGFNNSVSNLVSNINSVQTPFSLWTNLLSVILVLAVFAGFIYMGYSYYQKGKGDNKRGGTNEMGY